MSEGSAVLDNRPTIQSGAADERAEIERLLVHPLTPLGPERQAAFHAYQLKHYWRFLLMINLLGHFAFLSYSVADALVLPGIAGVSATVRAGFVVVLLPISVALFRWSRNAALLDLLLPVLTLVATQIWFELLAIADVPQVSTYLYASLIFLVLANISVQVRFLPSLVVSLLIAATTLAGVYRVTGGSLQEMLIFVLVYLPVFLFSLFISWSTTLDRRRAFLRAQLDEMTHSELAQANGRLQTLAYTDALTGIGNRRSFEEQGHREIERAVRQREPLCLLIFDIDHFKRINDTYGHDVGDQVLRRLSHEVQAQLRSIDLLARFGGEEFIVLLPNTALAEAEQVAERLRAHLEACEIALDGGASVRFTVSVGIGEFSAAARSMDDLLTQADQALYRAKKAGRNQVCVAEPAVA
jgi:diguanylate cyclase (GGDEF)-like protein